MNINEQFKQKFNELDQICKKLYPECTGKGHKPFDAIKHFADMIDKQSSSTLINLISARNVLMHDPINVINMNYDSIVFLQGLIDGANRKLYNNATHVIDSNLETLRTKNLKTMSNCINSLNTRLNLLSAEELKIIKDELKQYIAKEQDATNQNELKEFYFEFMDQYNTLDKREVVIEAKKKNKIKIAKEKATKLEQIKNKAINEIESQYCQLISQTSIFNISKRKNAKIILNEMIASIKRCGSLSEMYELLEYIDDGCFDDLDYD